MNRLAVAAVLVALVFAGGPASAQLTETTLSVVEAAADQLVGALQSSPDDPPRLTDPQVTRLFDLALPKAATTDSIAGVDELALQMAASASAGRIARAYLMAGTGATNPDQLTAEQQRIARDNFLVYLPELERIYDFRLLACARLADGVAAFLDEVPAASDRSPGVAAGVEAIGREVRAVLAATISFVADQNISEESRLGRMQLLTANARSFSRLFDLKESETVADQALAAAIVEQNPELAGHLKNFALAILR